MARAAVAIFPERASAEHAVADLKAAGFDPVRIGFIMRDQEKAGETANDLSIIAGAGAATGSVLGMGIGALLAVTSAFIIPGIGPFISAGILATLIAASGTAGAIAGALVSLGVPRPKAEYYARRVEEGGALLTLDPADREAEARKILLRHGAEDTWRTTPWMTQGRGADYPTPGHPGAPADDIALRAMHLAERGTVSSGTPETEFQHGLASDPDGVRMYPTEAEPRLNRG